MLMKRNTTFSTTLMNQLINMILPNLVVIIFYMKQFCADGVLYTVYVSF